MTVLVIGAGPAGLMAAQTIAQAGIAVQIVDQKPSVGRKFLMAGKSGLNLTKAEDAREFTAAYPDMPKPLKAALDTFGPEQVTAWATALGQDTFTGSTGRVFPTAMKSSPLLRAWLARLDGLGITIQTRHRWTGFDDDSATFDSPDGSTQITAKATILAMGGASWQRLGSDGAWAAQFPDQTAPFQPSNMGVRVNWSDHMQPHFGTPLKNIAISAQSGWTKGEAVVTATGIEGGGIYTVSAHLRDGGALKIDLLPDMPADQIAKRLAQARSKDSATNRLRKALKLPPAKLALLQEFARPLPSDPKAIATQIKALEIAHQGPMPIDGAISTAGGLRFDALDDHLMIRTRPGVFAAGEMLDWDARTGGYLITACLATGQRAGQGAVNYLSGLD